MASNHTPGPWSVDDIDTIVGPDSQHIATTWCGEGFGPDTENANALLICAAPTLLAALKGAIGALEFSRDYHSDLGNEEQAFCQDKLDAAVRAIALAEQGR